MGIPSSNIRCCDISRAILVLNIFHLCHLRHHLGRGQRADFKEKLRNLVASFSGFSPCEPRLVNRDPKISWFMK